MKQLEQNMEIKLQMKVRRKIVNIHYSILHFSYEEKLLYPKTFNISTYIFCWGFAPTAWQSESANCNFKVTFL